MSKITFTERAFAEYLYWQSQDKKTLKRINALLKDISRSPYEGIGKPEGLKENLSGYWSRRIDDVNRLVYRIENDLIEVYQCKGHYVPYKIGKLQIQGFSEPTTPNKIKQSYHITQKAARSRPRAAFLRGKLGRRQDFSKK